MDSMRALIQSDFFKTVFLMGIRGVSLISKFILTLFIARYMGFEDVGLYGLIMSATFIVPAFAGMGIMFIKNRNAVTQSVEEIVSTLRHYVSLVFVIYSVIGLVGLSIAGSQGHLVLVSLILCVVFFENVNNDLYDLTLNLSKPITANVLHSIRTSLWIFIFIILAFFLPELRTIEAILIIWIMGGVFALIGFFVVMRSWPWRTIKNTVSLKKWVSEELPYSKSIYIFTMLNTSATYMNYYLVAFFLGLDLTGVYVFFIQIISAMANLLYTGIIQNARPKLVRAFKEKDKNFSIYYQKCKKQTALVSLLMVLVAIPIMYFITAYIVEKPLALEWFSIFYLNLVYFGIIIAINVDQLVLYSHHRDDLILKIGIIDMLGMITLSLIFIPLFSLWGAACVLVCMALIKLFVQRQKVQDIFSENKIIS